MDFRIFTEPQQGASYTDLLRIASASEELGFDGFFRSDHYLRMGDGDPGVGSSDAWTSLAGLARDTSRIRLGTLVSSVTYRHPGILAVQVAGVDDMSGGRAELGLGTGWFKEEHEAYGIPFPTKRFGMLEEQLSIVTGMWNTPRGDTYNFSGEHYSLVKSPALPKPTQAHIPIIMGGAGPRKTPALAARFADEFNTPMRRPDEIARLYAGVRTACEAISRDPDDLVYSAAFTVAIGKNDAEVSRRAEKIGRDANTLRADGLSGTASEVQDQLGALAEIGVSRVYLQILDLDDVDHLESITDALGTLMGNNE